MEGKKMKRMSTCLAVVVLVMGLIVASGVMPSLTKAADVVEWRWVNMMPAKHWSSVLHIEMAKEIEKATNGKFKIMFYPGDMLIASRDAVQATVKGVVNLDSAGSNYIEGVIPVLGGDQLPFGGVTDEDWQKMVTGKGPLRKFCSDVAAEYGLILLSRWVHGNNGLASRVPLMKVSDWKGVKMRLFPLNVAFGKALGAEPVVMTGDEACDATRRGVLDASMLNAGAAVARGYGEFCKYYIEWPLGMMQVTLFASKKSFDALPPEYQKVLMEAVTKYEGKLWEAYYKDRDSAYGRLEKQGVKVVFPAKDELMKFAEVARPLNAKWAEKFGAKGQELLDIIAKYQVK
jgi:TRAP-type C4-dicarboxylate transport system substrate-binding protein